MDTHTVISRIKETIVVEGKDDETRLKKLFDCDIIKTNGTHLSNETIEQIKQAQNDNGVIIFTDPDHPGEEIRRIINEKVANCKNAFLTSKSRKKDLVGVEHASDEQIKEALSNLLTYTDNCTESLSLVEFNELKLAGKENSSQLRIKVEDYFHLGHGSAKTLFKRLQHKNLTYKDIEECLKK